MALALPNLKGYWLLVRCVCVWGGIHQCIHQWTQYETDLRAAEQKKSCGCRLLRKLLTWSRHSILSGPGARFSAAELRRFSPPARFLRNT